MAGNATIHADGGGQLDSGVKGFEVTRFSQPIGDRFIGVKRAREGTEIIPDEQAARIDQGG
jgi:hypothetical protein